MRKTISTKNLWRNRGKAAQLKRMKTERMGMKLSHFKWNFAVELSNNVHNSIEERKCKMTIMHCYKPKIRKKKSHGHTVFDWINWTKKNVCGINGCSFFYVILISGRNISQTRLRIQILAHTPLTYTDALHYTTPIHCKWCVSKIQI